MELTKKNDFVEIKYTGYANGEPFDSNIEEDVKKINDEAKPQKTLVCIGHDMVVKGLDKALEGKEIGKDYEADIPFKDGFGERKRELIRVLPLASFTAQKIHPQPGMVLSLDNNIVKIIAVSGARITTDFNNPLAGKDLKYKFKITRFVTDDKEKTESIFQTFLQFVPEFEVKEKSVTIIGSEGFDLLVNSFKEKFKEMIGKDLEFKLEDKKEEKKHKDDQPKEDKKDYTKLEDLAEEKPSEATPK